MVKPGGTGRPRLDISARLAPLPPSNSRRPALPSALPSPNRYTHLPAFAAAEDFTVFAVLDFAALAFTAAFLGAGRGGAFPTFLRAGAEAARFTEDFAFADDFLTLE